MRKQILDCDLRLRFAKETKTRECSLGMTSVEGAVGKTGRAGAVPCFVRTCGMMGGEDDDAMSGSAIGGRAASNKGAQALRLSG
jgi:hypothetical protein